MILGISYNIFDSEDLLEESINLIRDKVDFISVVYQVVSNYGFSNPELEDLLINLRDKGLIDCLVQYTPDLNMKAIENAVRKRNIGLQMSRQNSCTHHMSMDADEYYVPKEFEYMIKEIEKNQYDGAACQLTTYYKNTSFRIEPKETYYVSTIFKIKANNKFIINDIFPVLVDPSRIIKSKSVRIFSRNEIEMHHLSWVRKDISVKLLNSDSRLYNFEYIDNIINHFENWKFGEKALVPQGGQKVNFVNVIETKNLFKN